MSKSAASVGKITRESDLAVTITAAARTDIGCVRKNNQDAFNADASMHLYVVCDGMGGAAGGEVASRVAVEAFLESCKAALNPKASAEFRRRPNRVLYQAAVAANAAVLARVAAEPALRGMGSTLVAAHLDGQRLHLIHVGDSRAYLIRNGECAQLTVDHSYVEEQVSLGFMTREIANASPMQSVITRAVGIQEGFDPDLSSVNLHDGDFVLLTSDGLTRHLESLEIAKVVAGKVSVQQQSLDTRCGNLIDLAKRRGGSDNITCVLLHVSID